MLHSFDRDEEAFLAAYPEAENGYSSLINAIRNKQTERGERRRRRRKLDDRQ